ncbi:MAG: glycosyltransferase [Epsilonproteobacteria bacterium]|nr:glycosyltransferase [Campylobacterota bacterium]
MYNLSLLTVSQNIKNINLLLDSIEKSVLDDISLEFICSWNGDEKPDIDKTKYSFEITFIEEKPYHFSKNNNMLASKAKGKYLLFINDDVEVDSHCIINSYKAILKKDVGIVGVNLRFENQNIQHAGVFFDENNMPYHRYKNQIYYTDPRVSNDLVVPAVTGAYLMIEKTEFDEIKFEERCEVAAQDIILCIEYKNMFQKDILYVANATAIHYENATRKLYDQRTTPQNDLNLLKEAMSSYDTEKFRKRNQRLKVRIVTEKPGWIMHRKAEEIAKRLPNAVINEDYPEANIHYYINYGYFNKRPSKGVVVANFTHYDPMKLNDKWESVAKEVDHCVAVANTAAADVKRFGISEDKVSVIPVGADKSFKPKMTLGLVGRVYPGGRKGEHLVQALLEDKDLMQNLQIVALNDSWGVPVWKFDDMSDFYRSIDYLLVPSLYEGGPVPFMEALGVGTMSIAPAIGVIPDFPHIEYKWNDIDSLKIVISKLKSEYLERKRRISHTIEPYNWDTWALKHIALFHRLLDQNND